MNKLITITPEAQAEAINFFGKEICEEQLRLILIIYWSTIEKTRLSTNFLCQKQNTTLQLWRIQGHLHLTDRKFVSVTKEFFIFASATYFNTCFDLKKQSLKKKEKA